MRTERFSRWWWVVALGACAALAFMAVWMGGLNQDEGWYLYAANLVAGGERPYVDFAFTQGPVMPRFYALFTGIWQAQGILGARVFTLALGLAGVALWMLVVRALVPADRRSEASLLVFLLLGVNLYHLYYLAIPKTYALAALCLGGGYALLALALRQERWWRLVLGGGAGFLVALAAGVRISMAPAAAVTALTLVVSARTRRLTGVMFALGALAAVAFAYGPYLVDRAAFAGLLAAQRYHAARGGFDAVWVAGSVSRLIRWYLPVFIVLGLSLRPLVSRETGGAVLGRSLVGSFLAVFLLQMAAPFPYEDYAVPVMALLAVVAAGRFAAESGGEWRKLLVLGMALASSFSSPLIERWAINGQDRFWPLKKAEFELPQLREVAAEIEALDPGGKFLLTQDLYLAIETGRQVPKELAMGPFSILTDAEWRSLLELDASPVAALSGYTFAIEPPACTERAVAQQLEYWAILKRRYELVFREEAFGQNATPLLVLKLK